MPSLLHKLCVMCIHTHENRAASVFNEAWCMGKLFLCVTCTEFHCDISPSTVATKTKPSICTDFCIFQVDGVENVGWYTTAWAPCKAHSGPPRPKLNLNTAVTTTTLGYFEELEEFFVFAFVSLIAVNFLPSHVFLFPFTPKEAQSWTVSSHLEPHCFFPCTSIAFSLGGFVLWKGGEFPLGETFP